MLNHTNLLHKSAIFGAIFWDPTSSHIYGIHFIMVPYAYAKKYKKIVMRYHAAFEKNAFHFFRTFNLKLVPFGSMSLIQVWGILLAPKMVGFLTNLQFLKSSGSQQRAHKLCSIKSLKVQMIFKNEKFRFFFQKLIFLRFKTEYFCFYLTLSDIFCPPFSVNLQKCKMIYPC